MASPRDAPSDSSLLSTPFAGSVSSCCSLGQSSLSFSSELRRKRARNGASSATSAATVTPSSSSSTTSIHNQQQHEIMDDAALARELNELSVEEREQVLDDIHGVSKIQEETPEFWARRLEQLHDALVQVPTRKRKTYQRAVFLRPGLGKVDTALKRMHLRAESYNPRKAAERLIKYFDLKLRLFGEDKLVKRIAMQDLSSDDLRWIQSGFQVNLPFRDPSGRPIFFFDSTKLDLKNQQISLDCMSRSLWYLMMVTMEEDEVAQKVGICVVAYYSGSKLFQADAIGKMSRLNRSTALAMSALPCRPTSCQICYNHPKTEWFLGMLRIALGKFIRLRIRAHSRSDLEHDYHLMSLGIPGDVRLIQNAYLGRTTIHEAYIQRRREVDAKYNQGADCQAASQNTVPYPEPNDVLIGRGFPYHEFPGSQRLDELVYTNLARYTKCNENRFLKTCMSMELVNTVRSYGGRFLVRNEEEWKILDDPSAREKVASAFRTRSRPSAAGANKKTKLTTR